MDKSKVHTHTRGETIGTETLTNVKWKIIQSFVEILSYSTPQYSYCVVNDLIVYRIPIIVRTVFPGTTLLSAPARNDNANIAHSMIARCQIEIIVLVKTVVKWVRETFRQNISGNLLSCFISERTSPFLTRRRSRRSACTGWSLRKSEPKPTPPTSRHKCFPTNAKRTLCLKYSITCYSAISYSIYILYFFFIEMDEAEG